MNSQFIKFLLKHRQSRVQIILATMALIAAIVVYLYHHEPFNIQWANWIDMFITISTLVIAVFVWLNEKTEALENSLPKKLDIVYLLNGTEFANVKNAPLAGDDDIRNWGQSIAQTILNKQTRIEFSGFKTDGPNRDSEKKTMNYRLTIYLVSPIPGISHGQVFTFNDDGNLCEENLKHILKTEISAN